MRIIRSVPLSNAARFLAYSSNLRKVVGVPLWLRGVGKMLGSAEVHPIKRIPSFNPESVKILPLLFFFPLSLSPFVLQIIGGGDLSSPSARGGCSLPLFDKVHETGSSLFGWMPWLKSGANNWNWFSAWIPPDSGACKGGWLRYN